MTEYPEPNPAKSTWENARVLWADVDINPTAARLLVPPELQLADPARATVFVADYPDGPFGILYKEAALLIHTTDDTGPGMHCAWIMVDLDTALIQGRDLGFPKKMAELTWEETEDRVVGSVRRKGVELMRMEGGLGAEEPSPGPLFSRRIINAVGSVATGMSLIEICTKETFRSARKAEVKLSLGSSVFDPDLGNLDANPAPEGTFAVMDFGEPTGPPVITPGVNTFWAMGRFLPRSM